MDKPKYKRIILKISGEILGNRNAGEPIFAESLEKNLWGDKSCLRYGSGNWTGCRGW